MPPTKTEVATRRSRATKPRATNGRAPSGTTRRSHTATARDAIAVLKADHRDVERLFKEFERTGDTAYKTMRKLVDRMITALSQHAAIEEEVLYPAAREQTPGDLAQVLEALEEHHVVKWELDELLDLDPTDERFVAKVSVLAENVRHHVRQEEGDLFPALRRATSRAQLLELGAALERARHFAPSRPHPRSPDVPPAAIVSHTVAGVVDRARDAVRTVAH